MRYSFTHPKSKISIALCLWLALATACTSSPPDLDLLSTEAETGLEYLRGLEGKWVVQDGDEGPFGWSFELTSRGSAVLERLKVGTPTEMSTTYHLDNGALLAAHFCQLENQPHLRAVRSELEGDLHFLCDGDVGNTASHAELHMHGVHFQRDGERLRVWMDMVEDGEVAFETSYSLVRSDTESAN